MTDESKGQPEAKVADELDKLSAINAEMLKRHTTISLLLDLKHQAQALDAAVRAVVKDGELELENLLPACLHLNAFQIELLEEIRRQGDALLDLERLLQRYMDGPSELSSPGERG